MNTTQIRQLVAAKIAGQGTNVDAGSALPDIINGLCDVLDNLPAPLSVVEITEDLGDGDNPVEISQARYNELRHTGVLKRGDALYSLINPVGLIGPPHPYGFACSFYSVMIELDDVLALNGFEGVVLWVEEVQEQGGSVERFYIKRLVI